MIFYQRSTTANTNQLIHYIQIYASAFIDFLPVKISGLLIQFLTASVDTRSVKYPENRCFGCLLPEKLTGDHIQANFCSHSLVVVQLSKSQDTRMRAFQRQRTLELQTSVNWLLKSRRFSIIYFLVSNFVISAIVGSSAT